MNENLEMIIIKLQEKIKTLESENERLHELSMTDELTGLFNLRYLKIETSRLKELSSAKGKRRKIVCAPENIAIVNIDMNGFKQINDTFGHSKGDEAIKFTARTLKKITRENDIVVRPHEGGDEFYVVLYPANEKDAENFMTRFTVALKRNPFDAEDEEILLKASMGYYCRKLSRNFSLQTAIDKSDAAMYRNKQQQKAGQQ